MDIKLIEQTNINADSDWQYLQSVGEKVATRLSIETEEDVERIAG